MRNLKIALLVEEQYQVLEVWYPYLRLLEERIDCIFVGTGKGRYLSKEGYPVQEQIPIQKVRAADFSGVIIPGGYAPDLLRRFEAINRFVFKIFQKGGLVAAICRGGWVCVSAKILKGRFVTGFTAIQDDLVNAGAKFIDQAVVVDKNLITSRNPLDLPRFCGEIIKFLKGDGYENRRT